MIKGNSLIFGGSGFIGSHLSNLLESRYINMDIVRQTRNFQFVDVRLPIDIELKYQVDTIFNLAAIHTTPGHESREYFDTNINGAENVCNFARINKIKTVVFTSSIAPYGSWEEEKTEDSLPHPTSAYGSSKLIAEEIHKRWQAEDRNQRKLIIVRPGVVFGKNEGGNFTRLYNALKSGKFFYPGRKDTKKAAIYVKDLVRIMIEMATKENPGVHIYNTVYTPCYSIEEICDTMSNKLQIRKARLIIPSKLLKFGAIILHRTGKIVGKSFTGIHPDRVKKLMISTNINGDKLLRKGYKLKYSLGDGILDWFHDCDGKELS